MTTSFASDITIDPARWPDVATVPRQRLRRAVTRRLVRRMLADVPVVVTTSGGERLGAGRPGDPAMHITDPDALYARIGTQGLIGFGEAYMAGEWTATDLSGVLTVLAQRLANLVPAPLQRLRAVVLPRRPPSDANTPVGARRNIQRHYDLSNDLFSLFLDPTMTYSSAMFDDGCELAPQDLHEAQVRKIERLLDATGVGAGCSVLEIGTGWGELAVRAAARGATVTTITLSLEQALLARRRIEDAGYADRVEVRLQDYREVTGSFDAVLSVEMLEAVGADHWDEYFAGAERLLAPGGRFGIQAITMAHDRMLATANTYTWILKYIFPGGQVPSPEAIERSAGRAHLHVESAFEFGQHYAETLRRWREAFEAAGEDVETLGFDAVFHRMWSLYLAYSEAGFRSGYLDVAQLVLTRRSAA